MHSLYFVRLKKESAKTSEEARNSAYTILQNNGFAGESSFYQSSKADWFVIGGRWSGMFSRDMEAYKRGIEAIKALPVIKKKLEKVTDVLDYLIINDHMVEPIEKKEIEDAFLKASGGVPYFRSSFNHTGYDDDAKLIDKATFDFLMAKKSWEDVEVALVDENENIEQECFVRHLEESDIVGHWLVVVDYHS